MASGWSSCRSCCRRAASASRYARQVSEPTTEAPCRSGSDLRHGLGPTCSIRKRLADTTIELPSGGSMMIAGLVRDDVRQSISGFPGLSIFPSRHAVPQQGFCPQRDRTRHHRHAVSGTSGSAQRPGQAGRQLQCGRVTRRTSCRTRFNGSPTTAVLQHLHDPVAVVTSCGHGRATRSSSPTRTAPPTPIGTSTHRCSSCSPPPTARRRSPGGCSARFFEVLLGILGFGDVVTTHHDDLYVHEGRKITTFTVVGRRTG